MASSSDKDASCANDPDFAVICAFLEKFSEQLQVNYPDFKQLQEWISNTDEVPNGLRDLHIKLMRKIRRTVHECAWESALSKFCFFYSSQDGWEIERFGYKKSSLRVKLRILRELLESQFIGNNKFRAKVLTMSADSLRSEPIGRDRLGHSYWMTQDPECNIRIYQEHLDEEIWQVVATNREELVKLISRLRGNEVVLPSEIGLIDEDSSSNSCSALIEKPPPPEEKDDSQESNQSTGRIPNIKIKLGNKENGNIATLSNEPPEDGPGNSSVVEKEEEKKVKPLVISHSKIKMEKTKKRSLDECEKSEPVEVKKQRPSLLDPKREKKVGRYEQQDEDDDEHDDGGEEEDEEDDEEEDEEEDGDSEEEDEEDEPEEDEDIGHDEEDDDDDEEEEVDVRRATEDVQTDWDEKKTIVESSSEKKCVEETKEAVEVCEKNEENKCNEEETTEEETIKSNTHKSEEKPGEVQQTEESETVMDAKEDVECEEAAEDTAKDEKPDEQKEESEQEKPPEQDLKIEESAEEEVPPTLKKSMEETIEKVEEQQPKEERVNEDDIKMSELKTEEKTETIEEPVVGEAIEDPPMLVSEEGSGAECESSFFHFLSYGKLGKDNPHVSEEIEEAAMFVVGEGSGEGCLTGNIRTPEYEEDCLNVESNLELSEAIEEAVIFVVGEGSGADCLVGNAKTSDAEPEATFFFGQPGCLKLSPVKNPSKSDESENSHENEKEDEEIEKKEKKIPESTNGDNYGEVEEKKSLDKNTSMDKTKPEAESKNGDSLEERRPSRSTMINRKRRLSEEKPHKAMAKARLSSESETDINSEDLLIQDEEEEEDIGGKRLKMRGKQVNTEIRKKVEAQRNNAVVEETTTSSSGEDEIPRKKFSPKKLDKEVQQPKLKGKQNVKPKEVQDEVKVKDYTLIETSAENPEKSTENPTPKREEVSVEKEVATKRTGRSTSKQIKKPQVATSYDEADTEVPKQQQPSEHENLEKQLSPDPLANNKEEIPADLEVKTEYKSDAERDKNKSVEEDQQAALEKQRKRRSSEEDKEEAIQPPPPPIVLKSTRSSRRGGPPEPVYELPQIKRTRVKAVEKTPEKKEIKSKLPKVEETTVVKKFPPQTEEVKKENELYDIKKEEPPEIKEEPMSLSTKAPVTPRPRQQAAQKQPATSTGQRRKCHDDVDAKNILDLESDTTPVRMSRRIAQLKIREEADRRKMEEIALRNMKAELKKKKKAEGKPEDPTVSEPSEHSSDHAESEVEVKKKSEKKKKCPGKGGWSSGSEEPDEEEAEEHPYSDHGSPLFRSDHEFSPESELEDESQVVPLKRARTARKEGEEEVETHSADESCQKCGKSDHPEWILLCDKCNKGYHCSCLSPVIFYIPEGDWFCPPCQQELLIVALENHLKDFDDLVQRKKDEEEERIRMEEQQRLELEKAAQEKVVKKNERKQDRKKKASAGGGGGGGRRRGGANKSNARKKKSFDDDNSEEENGTETESSNSSKSKSNSSSDSGSSKSSSATDSDDEPIYKLRKRRQINVSYRLNEYDEMIKSALKKEEDAVAGAGNLGRGKDISNIIEAEIAEEAHSMVEENGAVNASSNAPAAEDSGSDFGPLKRKPKTGRHLKKKHRKLTKLDISSEGDNDSDEDFKTSSMDDEEEDDDEEEVSQSSDSSLDIYRRRRGNRKSKKKKKTRRAARHSARERRKDRRFIVDDSDADGSEEERKPRTKKKRKKDSDYTESETNDDDDDELSENINSEDLCDDSTDSEASDGAWCPSKRKKQRSSGIARKSPKLKPKAAPKPKKTKRLDDDSRIFKAGISKKRMVHDESDDDSDDSVDSSRKTRGKRCVYLEDYDDESSDGGIKPGVKRPDTPPEEREKFIKKQEEIKRMLAEKNAEGAKLAATPRLIPIKTGAQKSPAKLDSLSTVPLSVIRQAKVLDIDYLQRKGESISEGDMDESEFDDDDLPDDFNPEDMDEEAIARMVEEEEDFAQQQQLKLPLPSEVLRKKPIKEVEPVVRPVSTFMPPQAQQSTSVSGLQEPVRKKLPMPTMHPPLLRHGYGPPMMQQNRQPHLPLLQNALSAPLNHPMSRNFPPTTQAIPATSQGMGGMGANAAGGDPNKPRGRRKKITPLRDPFQKQQAAAAASAAAVAASKPRAENLSTGKTETRAPPTPPVTQQQSATPGVIKSALSIAQPPQLYKPPPVNTQPSVITRMPHLQGRPMMNIGSGPPFGEHGPRFYRPAHPQSHLRPPPPPSQSQQQQVMSQQRPPPPSQSQHRPPTSQQSQQPPPNSLIPGNRPPMRHRGPPMPPMTSHHSLRTSFVGGPPPLRPSSSGGPPISLANDIARDQGPPRQSTAYSGPEQQYPGPPPPTRHSAPPPPHLSPYRPQMYNNPGFPHRGPPTNSSQPSIMRPGGPGPPPEYSSAGSYVGGYGYYPPTLSVPHSAPPPPTASAVPSSVIVSASSLSATTSVVVAPPQSASSVLPSRPPTSSSSLIEKQCTPVISALPTPTNPPSVIELSRKKLTTLETFNKSKTATPPPLRESSESRSPYSSNPPTVCGPDDAPEDNSASPPASSQSTSEFSGLVSYFSSQHDDLNT